MNDTDVIELAKQLIQIPSVTPKDGGCQNILADRLAKCGFSSEFHPHGNVTNLWSRNGTTAPLLVFAGHTDVVPPGPLEQWQSPPFQPTIHNNKLYGRGAADMKSSIAAMVTAVETFVSHYPTFDGSIGFLITSDEEGDAIDGTKKVVESLIKANETIDWCIVGEASSEEKLGDQIRIGRRGSLTGQLIIEGKQGHVAYPDKALNPIHIALNSLGELTNRAWDSGNAHFPPTSFQISNIQAGTGAANVVPGQCTIDFNFRFSTESTDTGLKQAITDLLAAKNIKHQLTWKTTSNPYYTKPGKLTECVISTIEETLDHQPKCSTSGGTSDGRFIATTGAEVIELGPLNASVHQVDEHILLPDLIKLKNLYYQILVNLLAKR